MSSRRVANVQYVWTGANRRGNYKLGLERRALILDAAAARFAGGGFSSTTLTQLAEDAGVSLPGVRHHFPSKEDILVALAERRFDAAALTADEVEPDKDGLGTLRLMLAQTRIRSQNPELIEVFIRVAGMTPNPDGAAKRLFEERYERVVADLTARFESAAQAGLLREGVDFAAVARDFIAASDGLQLQWVISGGRLDMVGLMRAHLERLGREILPAGVPVDLSEA